VELYLCSPCMDWNMRRNNFTLIACAQITSVKAQHFYCKQNITYKINSVHVSAHGRSHPRVTQKVFDNIVQYENDVSRR
jgi:hypothetical protein